MLCIYIHNLNLQNCNICLQNWNLHTFGDDFLNSKTVLELQKRKGMYVDENKKP